MMRFLPYIISLLVLGPGLNAVGQIHYWVHPGGQSLHHELIDIDQTKDGTLYLTGRIFRDDTNTIQPFLFLVSTEGEIIRANGYPGDGLRSLKGLIPFADGGALIYGAQDKGKEKIGLYANRVDPKGTPYGRSVSLTQYNLFPGAITAISDQEAIMGESIVGQNGLLNQRLNWIDLTRKGKNLRTRKLVAGYHEENNEIVVGKDGSLLVLGRRFSDSLKGRGFPLIYKLDAAGELLWTRTFEDFPGSPSVDLTADNKGNAYLMVARGTGNKREPGYWLIQLNPEGGEMNRKFIEGLMPQGLFVLKDQRIAVFGGFATEGGTGVVTKGAYQVIGARLAPEFRQVMGDQDRPDSELPELAMTLQPTTSDLMAGMQLADGRLAFAGWVSTPDYSAPELVLRSPRHHRNMLVVYPLPRVKK